MKTCPKCDKQYDDATKFCPTDGTTLRSAAGDEIIGSIIADRYHVIRKLGEGGMGQVYLAEHVKMGRLSAIKVMTQALANDVDAVGRFNREAANASKISHPNIAAIYDFGETSDGLVYLAMEFVEGESLTKMCDALGALDAPRAAEIARQVANALEAAHERGIVHRDLKPDNIMISRGRDGGPLVKVVDFGIAKAAEGAGQKVTRTGLVVGTPEYMSPEQLTGDTLDGRSDLYALALVTFNMLTGMLPFTGQTTQEALLKRLTDRPLTLSEARPDLYWPPALLSVMDRALSRLASDRYQHANEFGAAIVQAVAGMNTAQPQAAQTQVIPGSPTAAAPTIAPRTATTSSGAATRSGASVSAPTSVAANVANGANTAPTQGSAMQRYAMPLVLAIVAILVVSGAVYLRRHANGAATTVASNPTVDSAASKLGTSPAASTKTDSDDDKADSSDAAGADSATPTGGAAPSAASSTAPTTIGAPPSAVPAPAPAPAPEPPATSPRGPFSRRRQRALPIITGRNRATPPPSTGGSPESEPPAPPSATSPTSAPASSESAPVNAEQARARVDAAERMVDEGKTAEAMATVRGAMPLLPTRDDSVTALFYLSRAMIQRAAKTGDAAARKRACSILTLISKATSHPKAAEIGSFSSQECK